MDNGRKRNGNEGKGLKKNKGKAKEEREWDKERGEKRRVE